ncbi:MAG: truB [Chlamydiales bacterium]|jgi:tRNA pseudouridine55 synthase|nr:truB [Chlamydiales bacterium]
MYKGILPVNKPKGITSFKLIPVLRKLCNEKTVGHAGTLDPFATGVLILLIGREYTKLSDKLLTQDKAYKARLLLGISTDTFDCEGQVVAKNELVPTLSQIEETLSCFQGEVEQIPPMFSAKKIGGKKLYDLARQGVVVERQAVKVNMKTQFISYNYPYIDIEVKCSKGTYIRSIADDMGKMLGCGAHLIALERTHSGSFSLEQCLDGELLLDRSSNIDLNLWLQK